MQLSAPGWFVREMSKFDPELRVRWSEKANIFMLERKIAHSKNIDTIKDCFSDEYIRARDGYVLVALIPHDKFSRSIFDTLRASDLWSNGGWEHMAKTIEEIEEREFEEGLKKFIEDIAYESKEYYSFLKYRDGETVFNIGAPQNDSRIKFNISG